MTKPTTGAVGGSLGGLALRTHAVICQTAQTIKERGRREDVWLVTLLDQLDVSRSRPPSRTCSRQSAGCAATRETWIDATRLGLFGVSAGGDLAALAATAPAGRLDRGQRVRAAVSWSGPMNLAGFYRTHPFVAGYLGCVPAACPGRYRTASPVNHVDAHDPPILLANSVAETVPLSQPREMIRRLSAAHVTHQLLTIPGNRHAGQFVREALPATVRFLRRHLMR